MGCIALILELSGKFKSVFPFSFAPMAYLSICFFATFWGFTGFRDQKFTTIKIDTYSMGKHAAQLMAEHIKNPGKENQNFKLTPQIVKRGSCKNLVLNS